MKRHPILSSITRRPARLTLWLALACALGFFAPLKSFILQWIIDSGSMECALSGLLLGVAVTVTSHALEYLCRRTYTGMACDALDQLRCRVMRAVLSRSMDQARGENDALYISALSTDMRALYDEFFMPLFNLVFWGAILLCAVGMYLFVSPLLLIVVALMSVPPLILPRVLGARLSKERSAFSEEMGRYTHRVKELLAGFEVIHLFGRERAYARLHAEASRENARAEERVQQGVNTTIVATSFLGNGTFIVVLFFGMLLVFAGRITLGYMVTASQLANFIIQPCQYLSQNYARLRATRPIRERLEALMRERPDEDGERGESPADGSVVCEEVGFAYPGAAPVLRGLSLTAREGEKIALTGASGCGKSTLAKVICRSVRGYTGSVRVGGAEVRWVPRRELNGFVGYIGQKTFLFDDTIYNNICLYEDFPRERVAQAVRVAGLEEYVSALADGLDTRVTENGGNLSGGQAQRIGIARAALRRYRVILADEITASLDGQTAARVMDNLLALDATVIAITHDTAEASLSRFDRVYRIEDGRV